MKKLESKDSETKELIASMLKEDQNKLDERKKQEYEDFNVCNICLMPLADEEDEDGDSVM